MLVSLVLGDANFLRRPCTFLFFCVDFFALGSQREPHPQWNIGGVGCLALGLCVGHVHFMCQVTQTLPNANPFLGGIWALESGNKQPKHNSLCFGKITNDRVFAFSAKGSGFDPQPNLFVLYKPLSAASAASIVSCICISYYLLHVVNQLFCSA